VSGPPENRVCELLAQSLGAWRLEGCVERAADGVILVSTEATEIRVERARNNLPFRWTVTVDGRARGAISLVAVLRHVRAALDAGYTPSRARIAGTPPVAS
jgi:hypothetical protein